MKRREFLWQKRSFNLFLTVLLILGTTMLAFMLIFFFTLRYFLNRLKRLTEDTKAIVSRKFNTLPACTLPKERIYTLA